MIDRHAPRAVFGAALLLACAVALPAAIVHRPTIPNVEQQVTFELVSSSGPIPGSMQWDFGDGTRSGGTKIVNKTYLKAGTFTVACSYLTKLAVPPITERKTITVLENRKITYAPAAPRVFQPVTFQAVNFLSPQVSWDFGDNTPKTPGGTSIAHTYTTPGSYQVRAWDLNGTSAVPVTAAVTVAVDVSGRSIICAPASPTAGQPAAFTAVNFLTPEIKWDFGDGSPEQTGSVSIAHTYERSGDFTVRAWDWNGAYGGPTSLTVAVRAIEPPPTPQPGGFRISFLQLRFDDGKPYAVVPRGAEALRAFADIQYEGTGLLRMQWTVDGAPFGPIVTRTLSFSATVTLDSGTMPGLPAIMPGMHEVGLLFYDPRPDFVVPVLRYFVAADETTRPEDLKGIAVAVDAVRGVAGASCALDGDRIEVPAGRYALIQGSIASDMPRPVGFALLRVHLGDRLIDQQLLTDLAPGERRPFETSVLNPSADAKILYLTVYELDRGTAGMIGFRKLAVASPGSSR